MKILRKFVLVLVVALGIGLCFNPAEKVNAASGVGTVKNIKKSKVKHVWNKKVNGKLCSGNYRTISWKKIKGANGYVVYRYDDLLNEWNKVLTTKNNSFIISSLLQDETFTIKICAYKKGNKGKVYGDYSKEFKYKENTSISLRNKKKLMTKGCYAEGKDGYCEYASKQAFIIQNQYRAEKGIAPLIWSNELYNFAKIRSKDLTKLYEHTRPDGQGCQDFFVDYFSKERCRIFQENFRLQTKSAGHEKVCSASNCYTENAGCGYYGPEMKMKRWKASLPHYSNLLDTDLVSGAISCYRDNEEKEYWIGSFAVIDIDSIR
ncbi:CAP domain-containing protein [Eubacterium sp. LMAG:50]|uniref:CAP domain-containing protein n=1 Tax=Eubacterium sp. LMAG:50 TaxID=1969563 RepID=UPI0025C3F1E6|nr:CAP domain-containing protein [Eubacterium sp. LMAG:50]